MESATVTAIPAPAPRRGPLLALLGVLTVLAGAGAYLAVGVLGGEGHGPKLPPPPAKGTFAIAEDVPTSFGFVAVEHAETVKGVTAKAVAGQTHAAGFIGPDKAQVQVSVVFTNLLDGTLRYSPAQFELLKAPKGERPAPDAKGIRLTKASVQPGTLQPDASIDVRLSFTVPRDRRNLFVRFRDPSRPKPLLVDLQQSAPKLTAAEKAAAKDHH